MARRHTTRKCGSSADGKKPNPAFAWLMDFMRANPKAENSDAVAAAAKKKHGQERAVRAVRRSVVPVGRLGRARQ
jgi:hypothetical protein